jgi:16S rRNA C967 or C1407 C5-methylase (RsmB/RsmF family)/NOL1/NOP2/fmu family ribosome biogenesis protein
VNTLKVSAAGFCALAPFDLAPIPWCPAGFEIVPVAVQPGTGAPAHPSPGKHPYHAAGLYYLQDPAAMAAAELLAPRPGERILDLAAAPGGKATHIAALMAHQGLLIANEIHPQRAWELAGNLERWGARNAVITNETPERLAARLPGFFDRVLVDAPCSGEGMLRKAEAARREWTPDTVRGCALRQDAILEHAAALVRPGGRLVYATCTFNPEENEGALARFLRGHPDFALIELPQHPGFSPGRPEWLADDLHAYRNAVARAVRLWPHLAPGEGHFIAALERAANAPPSPPPKPWRPAKLPRPVEEAYRTFCAAPHPPWGDAAFALALSGAYLYALPAGLPDLTGLRYLHPGWWLGVVKKDRFEPSHALALGLTPQAARRTLDLAADAPETAAYLRGEICSSAGDDGWTLVTVDGFPAGWGKRTGGRLKSHYPKGLRRSS